MSIGFIIYNILCFALAGCFVYCIFYAIYKIIRLHIDFHKFKNDLKIGDEFEASCCEQDPFEEMIVYTIRIVDIKDDWLKYEKMFKDGSSEVCTCEIDNFWYKYF